MQPVVDLARARYDEFIRYCDNEFEGLMSSINEDDKFKNTLIIMSSDHGESFGHGYFQHGGAHFYEQVTHIPLIIKEPGQDQGIIIDDLVEQVDIPATILNLVNATVPDWMEGRSFKALMRGKKLIAKPVFSMNFENNPGRGKKITKGTVVVWDGDYKLIHYLEKKESLLFNLKEDSGELNNLFSEKPEIGQRLLSLVLEHLDKSNKNILNAED